MGGDEKEKHNAMGSLLTSYRITIDEVLPIISDKTALRLYKVSPSDVLTTMGRRLHDIIKANDLKAIVTCPSDAVDSDGDHRDVTSSENDDAASDSGVWL